MANSPARSTLEVGSVIADTYVLEQLIGRGGMGAVFLASHVRLPGKYVAIKVLHADVADGDVLARFNHEATIASQLNHPNIVAVHDFNTLPDGTPYLIMDFLEGETLYQRLLAGPIPLEHALSIMREVGSALAAAHRIGVIHRDLKPQNIFLVRTEIDGRTVEVAKVLDFGISKMRGSQTVKTQDNALLGTPQYMSPEQAIGQHTKVDERTDVFALGSILYEMLSGHAAFAGASIPEVVFKVVYEQPLPLSDEAPTIPRNVTVAIEQAMAKTANDRFSSIGGFVEALTGEPLAPPHTSGAQVAVDGPTSAARKASLARVGAASTHGAPKMSVAGQIGETQGPGVAVRTREQAAVPAPAAAPATGGQTVVGVGSSTVASVSRPTPVPDKLATPARGVLIAAAATAAAAQAPPSPPVALPLPRRSPRLIVGVLISVAAIVVAVYALTRGTTPAVVPARDGAPPVAVAVAMPDAVAPVAVIADAATPVAVLDAEVVIRAHPDAASPHAGQPPPKPGSDASADSPAVAEARSELALGQLPEAIHTASVVINNPASSSAEVTTAYGIRGAAYCRWNHNEDARTDLNKLADQHDALAAAARRKITETCSAAGFDLR